MTATEVLDAVERAGGSLALNGAQIKYTMPKEAAWLLHELKQNRKDLIELLRENGTPPPMPPGVRLLKWEPKTPPVAVVRMGIVSNVDKFIGATVRQLRARLEGKDFLAGNWSRRELVDRLEQVGVVVSVENAQSSSVEK
ncbi:MAG: hypothetical protein DMG76_25850 [Acidobacteria bacterium]|jgi:hypothetical protein|nr:MAG: hypothetical protein DMG76_25850 [Acidobacteriota bacterium]